MNDESLLTLTENGLCCRDGNFYIDPWKPVNHAVVTHAHGDHYAYGCKSYLVAETGEKIFRKRLGPDASIRTLAYGEPLTVNSVKVSLHPAGHILGSAQIRLERNGYVEVISGDYKLEDDGTCTPFELVRCNHFITEATFGLPIFRWQGQQAVFDQINSWWRGNAAEGKASLMYCYALGKSQRIIMGVDHSIGPIYTHGSVEMLNIAYRDSGVPLPQTTYAMQGNKSDFRQALIVAPLSTRGTGWVRRFGEHSTGYASGWMRIRGTRRRQAVDRGFVLSDHADWDGLYSTVKATGAERIGVTHGYVQEYTRWLREQGLDAYELKTLFGEESDDSGEVAEA